MLKKILKIIAILLCAILVIAIGYVAYVFISFHRLPDVDQAVTPTGETLRAGQAYTLATWNLGFGAYSDDYGFFMDGGTESWAFSKDAVYQNLGYAEDKLKALNPDLMILQELDIDATRSYHVDEAELMRRHSRSIRASLPRTTIRRSCSIPSRSPTARPRRAS